MCLNDPAVQLPFGVSNKTQNCSLYSKKSNIHNGMLSCDGVVRHDTIFRDFAPLQTLDTQVDSLAKNEYLGVIKIDIESFETTEL